MYARTGSSLALALSKALPLCSAAFWALAVKCHENQKANEIRSNGQFAGKQNPLGSVCVEVIPAAAASSACFCLSSYNRCVGMLDVTISLCLGRNWCLLLCTIRPLRLSSKSQLYSTSSGDYLLLPELGELLLQLDLLFGELGHFCQAAEYATFLGTQLAKLRSLVSARCKGCKYFCQICVPILQSGVLTYARLFYLDNVCIASKGKVMYRWLPIMEDLSLEDLQAALVSVQETKASVGHSSCMQSLSYNSDEKYHIWVP